MDKKNIIIALFMLLLGGAFGWFFAQKQSEVTTATTGGSVGGSTTYTCAMHPQIRQNEPGICPICEMDLTPLKDTNDDNPYVLQMTENAVKLAGIQTVTVGEGSTAAGKTLRLSGKIQADERRAAGQTAHVSGRIERLYVTFTGERVGKGQKLADIYAPELITAQRELLEAIKLKDISPGLAEAARNKLRLLKINDQTITDIEASGKVREIFTVYADEVGIVTERRVSVGDYVRTGQTMFNLVNLKRLWVLFDAYEEDLAQVNIGDKVRFSTPALPGDTFNVNINFIDPVLNSATRTASLRGEIINRGQKLKPGMLVTGSLRNTNKAEKSALTVPKSAVLWTGKRSVVYTQIPDAEVPTYEFKEIEIGESRGDNYLILSGLEPGDAVVTYGAFTLDAAAQLSNRASMMNRNIGVKRPAAAGQRPDYTAETPAAFQQQMSANLQAYFDLKNALVDTDGTQAQTAAADFVTVLTKTDMSLLKGEAHEYWMQQQNALRDHAQNIAAVTDTEAQRKQFSFLSLALINAAEAFGTAEETVYVQHCPMALGNTGADWLAETDKVLNPYFGDKMLKCGVVKRTIE